MSEGEKDSGSVSPQQSAPRPGGYYLAKYLLRGSAVIHAVRGHLRSPTSDDIVFGKETSLELVVIDEDGIVQSICEQPVFGIIKDLAILGWNDKFRQSRPQMIGKDQLVVLSDSGKLSFLAFSFEMHRFLAMNHIQLSKPGNSIDQVGRMLAVDPDGCFIAASAFEDQFALFSMSTSVGDNMIDEKMFYPPEYKGETSLIKDAMRTNVRGTIWSMCFVSHGTDCSSTGYYPILATIMHRKARLRNELLLFGCNIRTRAIQFISSYPEAEIGPLALNISAVPHLSGFAVVFRIGDALLMDFRDPYSIQCVQRINFGLPSIIEEPGSFHESSRSMDIDDEGMSNVAVCALLELSDSAAAMAKDDPMNIDNGIETTSTSKHVCACCWEPDGLASANLVLCLDVGELYILEIHSTIEGIRVDISDCLYRCVPCKELIWLKGGFVMGLIEMGDGFVLKLDDGGLVYKSIIQNIAPILDLAVVDDHDEKQDQMFSCCGMSPVGSLRVIRTGLSVDKLVKTTPNYEGITGTWTLRMKKSDPYHSFLVVSFVEETRVLSVGLNFVDVTDAIGFQADVCTLACGLVSDGFLVQIHRAGVRLCLPTTAAHVNGFPLLIPFCTSWCPDYMSISSGAVGHNVIVVSTSSPCFLFVLGIRSLAAAYQHELYEIHHWKLLHEVSCISIPEQEINFEQLLSIVHLAEKDNQETVCNGDGRCITFVIGTHAPSVEVIFLAHDQDFRILSSGEISIDDPLETPISSCIPEDVRLVLVDRFYVLAGLRNGILLRYELSQTSVLSSSYYFVKNRGNIRSFQLELIAIRRLGAAPVVLVPLRDALDTDVVVLCEMPWLLHVARHSIVYTSISFQTATHVTAVSSFDCPNGILFVADSSLHLLELGHHKRINVRKFSIEGTPRKVLYHKESKTLLILRTGLRDTPFSSDICRVDPFSGVVISKFPCELGETAKCMQIMKVGYQHLLVVGTSQCPGRTIMPSGEAESTKGRLIILSLGNAQNTSESSTYQSNFSSPSRISSPLHEVVGHSTEKLSCNSVGSSPDDCSSDGVKIEETEAGLLRVIYQNQLSGAVLAVCPFLNRYLLASSGNILNVFCFVTENPLRLRRHSMTKTRFTITCLTTCFTRIAVGDCRDGILFYSYTDDLRKLEQLYSDPVQRLVADCTLLDMDTAVVSDRRGSISVLSDVGELYGSDNPEKNLLVNCSYYMGESVMSIRKGLFLYRSSVDDLLNDSDGTDIGCKSLDNNIVASTLLGSMLILIPVTSEEHYLLETVQARLAVHPLTAPVLGNDHKEFRGRLSRAGVPTMLDGDMLLQFLELTLLEQEAVLSLPLLENTDASSTSDSSDSYQPLCPNQVIQILERIHHAST
ncbi:splicing factor 3B subunit 3 isoform X1 [Dendrobium catenatum]|uniref:DNA damage-binding protein 1b n=3 Tax=Dendrobium catenatum TaxID=906689 RepID=A0A2I0X3J0_9ASPA|nr:splicing factor 3B subunit 3 isoform X1 [Dendrobium catenatum]PKU82470.1 DNA damage-binding protein 1b [Dendrobium catenatum]